MTLADICALPVPDLAADDAALFLWVTMPMIREGLAVIDAWGFTYKTCAFTWIKMNGRSRLFFEPTNVFVGLGRWTRGNAELCLLATRGKPKRVSAGVRQVVLSPRQKHSEKPAEVRDRIVALMGDLPRLELFARHATPGWDIWGNEVDGSIDLKAVSHAV